MANAIFPKAKQSFLSAGINLTTDTIKVAMVSGYTYTSTHQFLTDVTGAGSVVGTAQTLTSVTVTNGVLNAAGAAFTGLSSTSTVSSFVIYKDTGTASTSPLIAYIDTGTGLPIVLNTSITEVDVAWDTGSNKIFAL